jgi:hypothetical protein
LLGTAVNSMSLFFSRTTRWAQISLAIVALCLALNGQTIGQELSPATKKLFEAVNNGDLAQVQTSIANGANFKATNTWGITPVDLAVDKGHLDIVHYLLKVFEVKIQKGKMPPVSLPTNATSLNSPAQIPAPAERLQPVTTELGAVAEVYSPPPGSNPWSATVVTTEPPPNSSIASVTRAVNQSKSAAQQVARNFPLIGPAQAGAPDPPEKTQNNKGGVSRAMSDFSSNKNEKSDKGKKSRARKEGSNWRAKDFQQAKILPKRQSKKASRKLPKKILNGVVLSIGRTTALSKPPPPQTTAYRFYQSCINKNLGSTNFCIENLDWPENIRGFFLTNSIMSEGTHTIVRYDEGAATYFHTLFPSKSYASVVNFFTQRFGPPTQKLKRSISPLAAQRRINPTAIWQSISTATKLQTSMEVRMYDDNRGGFPDTKHGAVYLYHEKSRPVFPHVSLVELMLLRAEK